MNLTKLRAIAKHAPKYMSKYTWEVFSAKEIGVRGILEPPCAALVGSRGSTKVILDKNGYAYYFDNRVYDFILDQFQRPRQIALELSEFVKYSPPA